MSELSPWPPAPGDKLLCRQHWDRASFVPGEEMECLVPSGFPRRGLVTCSAIGYRPASARGGPDPGQTRSRSVSQCADHLDEDAIWSPLAIAPLTLTGTAVSIDNLGHLTYQLWLIWIIAASVALSRVRRERIDVGAVVVASS